MTLRVAVDLGTSSTCVAISVYGREPQVVAIDGHPLMPSSVFVASDGTVFVGQEADRQAAIDPSRYEPHPKRRIDEPELLLGNTVLAVREVIRAVLRRAVTEACRVAGGVAVDQLVLTHPADWGSVRTRVLRQAANGLAEHIALVPEPVAAAVFHAASFPPAQGAEDRALAVLDLGGGTVDISVVRARSAASSPKLPARAPQAPSFHVLATRGDPTFGGADIDQFLLEHIGTLVQDTDQDAWRALIEGRELADRRRRRVIRQDVRGAKETLSRHAYTDVPLPPPFPDAHVTRADLERLISGRMQRVVELTDATIQESGQSPAQLAGIFLVGGSSRIPMIAQLVHARTGVVPTTLDQPETVVSRGALRAVSPAPDRTGVLAARVIASSDAVADRAPFPQPPPLPPSSRPGAGLPSGTGSPPGRPSRPGRRLLVLLAGGGVTLVAVVLGLVVLLGSDPARPGAPVSASGGQTTPSRLIAQYEYRFALPDGWTQTGGDPAKLRTEVKPSDATQGRDLVLIEQTRLSFDSDVERSRAVGKLRADFESAGASFSGFRETASFAGREVISYQERLADATVDWYVLFKSHTQVSVGCLYTDAGRDPVQSACEAIVRTLTITE
jgi:type VII secretion-associated protein (TIGR03931 family)